MAGSVIQATGTVEFEDGLRMEVLPGGCWCPCMGGIKLQLLCGVRIELAVGALPYLARIPVQVPPRALWGYSKYLHVEEGVLQTRQPLGLEAEPRDRGLPITGSRIWGPIKQTNKQTNKSKTQP